MPLKKAAAAKRHGPYLRKNIYFAAPNAEERFDWVGVRWRNWITLAGDYADGASSMIDDIIERLRTRGHVEDPEHRKR